MLSIISPTEFNLIKWKNGKGTTTELAISDGGDINQFDWRLSIASVTEDGAFSHFAGYDRTLILLSGDGITLDHQHQQSRLTQAFDVARFDGGANTIATLTKGAITDFNVMVRRGAIKAEVETRTDTSDIQVSVNLVAFAFSPNHSIIVTNVDTAEVKAAPPGYLVKMTPENNHHFNVHGEQFIVINFMDDVEKQPV